MSTYTSASVLPLSRREESTLGCLRLTFHTNPIKRTRDGNEITQMGLPYSLELRPRFQHSYDKMLWLLGVYRGSRLKVELIGAVIWGDQPLHVQRTGY